MEVATRCGILVAISVSSGIPTVEQTFNLIFAVMRHTPQEDRAVREGIFAGVSSGAVIACARRIGQRLEGGHVVCLLADGGWKYLSTGLWNREYKELEAEVEGKLWW